MKTFLALHPFPAAIILLCAFVTLRSSTRADDYQGADAILKQLDVATGATGEAGKSLNPLQQLRADAARYANGSAALSPEEAARAWLALFDRAAKLPARDSSSMPMVEVFRVLPPPTTWDALAAQVATRVPPTGEGVTRTTAILQIIVGTLRGDYPAVRKLTDSLITQRADNGMMPYTVRRLQDALDTLTNNGAAKLADFENLLTLMRPDAELSPTDAAEKEGMLSNNLEVPNLVALAGPERAEKLLKDLFTLPLTEVGFSDERTRNLARKVALETGDGLKFAPWGLAHTLDSGRLYELLVRRFPVKKSDSNYDRSTADTYYLLGLIAKNRQDDAAALALKLGQGRSATGGFASESLPEGALENLAVQGHAPAVFRFFDGLLSTHPELPYWQGYTLAAILSNETDAMLARFKAASERGDLKPAMKTELRKSYGQALLAADHVAEALPILQETATFSDENMTQSQPGNVFRSEMRARLQLASLGRVLPDPALLNEQLDAIIKAAGAQTDSMSESFQYLDADLVENFLAAKRGPELERLCASALIQQFREHSEAAGDQAGASRYRNDGYVRSQARNLLGGLVELYDRAGRCADVVVLLDHAKQWGAMDLADLLNDRSGVSRELVAQLARALQKTGHADAALRLVNADLDRRGSGSDPNYALLLELLPPDRAEARLNELFQADQFEERPLIWRAFLQLGQNRLDDAEKSARQAIGIDPSDGEQGRGDRMRAYAVLGDILERKGDTAQAKQMRQAVQAIRLSEDADVLHSAGLLKRAIDLYEQALGHFSNAYCIQSRLAIQLTTLGKLDEAMQHYERAYELMPESFGRMESHCFGCERAFAGQRAQDTAERVFQRLAAQQPTNPRVHYLLGYLRNEENHPVEAAREFREAVRLDPDYINAWKQLGTVSEEPADRDRSALNLLRLDPRLRHDSVNLSTVADLPALWKAVEATAKFIPPKVASIYALPASKAFMEETHQSLPSPATDDDESNSFQSGATSEPTSNPRLVILRNVVISAALQSLMSSGMD